MFVTASRIHNGKHWLPEGTVIEVAADGRIKSIGKGPASEEVQYYEGIIAPCFVNAHCHIELSHLKGKVPEKTGLIPFLKKVVGSREEIPEYLKADARKAAVEEMLASGIIAVCDIANSTDTLDVRSWDKLHIHTFVECLGFSEERAQNSFSFFSKIYTAFKEQSRKNKYISQSLTPHSAYSVSKALFQLIDDYEPYSIFSIHNQETAEENTFYRSKEGRVLELLTALGIDITAFQPSGKSSLLTYGEWLSPSHPLILVHNTFSSAEDICYIEQKFPQAWWCLCPNANLYIEDRLPDIELLWNEGANICIGTDSLASNHQLCVLSELFTIKERYPSLGWETLLQWGTYNGAQALQMDTLVGSIEPDKSCGLVQIQDIETSPRVNRII